MKRSPEMAKIEEMLQSSKLSSKGFLAEDNRPLEEIVEADAALLEELGYGRGHLAARMRKISDLAAAGLGTAVDVGDGLMARVSDTRGEIPCPWPHEIRCSKTSVYIENTDTGESLCWSMLSIHMIEAHGFFGGHGSTFRLNPAKLVKLLFTRQ